MAKQKIDGGPKLVLTVPNVKFSKGNFTGYNFAIRGIGSQLVAGSGDAGVGIHLNNSPLVANNLSRLEFYDVERVEVLRGPQARSTAATHGRRHQRHHQQGEAGRVLRQRARRIRQL